MPTYTGISSEAFRHPLDLQAEQALRSLPGFDLIARQFVNFVYERPQLVYLMGNSIQVGQRQYSSIYQIFSKKLNNHIRAVWYFIHGYNAELDRI